MNVLIINDDEVSTQLQRLMVTKAGIARSIKTALHAKDALIIYEYPGIKEFPDLILLDIHMPLMDGWEFLEEFTTKHLNKNPATRVIITSFSISVKDRSKAEKYPCVIDFRNESLTPEYLRELVKII
jgi:response regulator of citrate/malate metabolism